MKPIYTAVNAAAARGALEELTEKWGAKYGAIIWLWNNAGEEFIPFLDYNLKIRTMLCSTNAIKSLNARYRRGGQGPRPLPDRTGRVEVPLPSHPLPGPTGQGRARWTMRWKPALNAFAITFADRWPATETY